MPACEPDAGAPWSPARRSTAYLAVDRLDRKQGLVLQRSYRLASVVIGDGDGDLRDVVRVVRFGQRVAEARRIDVRARFAGRRHKRRVHGYPNHVIARRHRRLSIAAVEEEVLAAQLPDIDVRPSLADALVTGNADRPAAGEVGLVVGIAGEALDLLDVDHAEAALRGPPHMAR